MIQALGVTRSFLFVGCPENGLADPNWGLFIKCLRDFNFAGGHELRHFRLVRQSERFKHAGRRSYCEEFFRELLKSGLVEREPGLVDRCLNETAHPSWDVFPKVLRRKNTKPERKTAILRLLRSRSKQIPKLIDAARELTESRFKPLEELASEIAGVTRVAQIAVELGGTTSSTRTMILSPAANAPIPAPALGTCGFRRGSS